MALHAPVPKGLDGYAHKYADQYCLQRVDNHKGHGKPCEQPRASVEKDA